MQYDRAAATDEQFAEESIDQTIPIVRDNYAQRNRLPNRDPAPLWSDRDGIVVKSWPRAASKYADDIETARADSRAAAQALPVERPQTPLPITGVLRGVDTAKIFADYTLSSRLAETGFARFQA
jgi:hypothetical protein